MFFRVLTRGLLYPQAMRELTGNSHIERLNAGIKSYREIIKHKIDGDEDATFDNPMHDGSSDDEDLDDDFMDNDDDDAGASMDDEAVKNKYDVVGGGATPEYDLDADEAQGSDLSDDDDDDLPDPSDGKISGSVSKSNQEYI